MCRSVEEIEATRLTYDRNLEALARECRAADEAGRRRAADLVGECSPFFLTYQGKNDRELQRRYGVLIAELMQQRYPRFSRRPQMPPVGPGGLIRVGFASSFFFRHSNWKIPDQGMGREPRRAGCWCRGVEAAGQGAGDLGIRMCRALETCPPGPAVLVGADIPALDARHVAAAFRLLGSHVLVFGPAADGGFWLVADRLEDVDDGDAYRRLKPSRGF
jgi:hypothetical protein